MLNRPVCSLRNVALVAGLSALLAGLDQRGLLSSTAVFVTAGTGGTSLRTVNLEDPEVDYFEAWNATTWGVVDLHITRETLDLRFVPAEGGSFRDQVTIRAPSGGLVDAPTAN